MDQDSSRDSNRQTENIPQMIPVVGIGASAGGLEAFKAFFGKMPADTGMAFVLIPHLDPDHKSQMVEIIGRHSAMPAVQVEKRMAIEPNLIYIAPSNRNLSIEGGELVPCEISRQRGINLPVDFFFRSLAAAQKERAIGVVLSGAMSDGALGLKEIKEHGGLVIAQAPETARHDGMPRSAIDTGMVDLVMPIEEMPDAIIKFITHPYIHGDGGIKDEDALNQVLAVIHARSSHDFRSYKRNTLVRRTERRMDLRRIEKMTDYVDILKREPNEVEALHKDMLFGVTGFFREEPVWEKLGAEILPLLLNKRDPDTPLRIWIPGCSTGEEAYTIVILTHDAFERLDRRYNAQVFATDIDCDAIMAARSGVYPESTAADLSPEHLEKYFDQVDRGYRVLPKIRESIVFAVQNLLGDVPFSNLDMISCRNLLIHLEPDVQEKVIELFHFALRAGGYLVLGNSETIGYQSHLFETVSKGCRIYRAIERKDERARLRIPADAGGRRGVPFGMRPETPRKTAAQLMRGAAPQADPADGEETLVRRLEAELMAVREDLQNTIEELETSNEELKTSNEEMMSMNEDLDAVNTELREKIGELERANNDLANLMDSTEVATVFLDMDSAIRRFTSSAKRLFNLIPNDVGRPIGDLACFSNDDLKDHISRAMETLTPVSKEVETGEGRWFIRRVLPFKTRDHRIDGVVLTFSDVTEMKQAETALRASREQFRLVTETIQDVFWMRTRGLEEMIYVSPTFESIWETPREVLYKNPKTFIDKIHPDDLADYLGVMDRYHRRGLPYAFEYRIIRADGGVAWIHERGYPVSQALNGKQIITGVCSDITERKRVEAELRKSKALLEATGRMARVGGWELDPETSTVTWTEETYRIHEVPMDHMPPLAEALDFYPPDDRERLSDAIQRALNHGEPYDLELGFVSAKNRDLWVRTVCQPVVVDGKTVKLSGTFQDITDRKNAELALKKALAEKETLLREIHHRVKNNMQAIVGLLRMHARRTDDAQLTEIFSDCRDRIGAMSLIHEALYQSDDLAKIDLKGYLKKLCRNLAQAHDAQRKRIGLTVAAADVSMNMDQGIAVGMIVAELISNAFKHAFPDGQGGTVAVHLDRPDEETVRLIVSDTGKGPPEDFDIENPSSLGLKLVWGAVTRELGGTIDVERDTGTRYIIRFRCDNQN